MAKSEKFDNPWFILASGPSQVYKDIKAVRGKGTVCAVNSTVFSAPWADILYAADKQWWKTHGAQVRAFDCVKVSVTPQSRNYGAEQIVPVGDTSAKGLGRGVINRGGNSGYQAINLAYMWGAREIVLLGFDMAHTFGRRHYHGDHPSHLGMGNADGVETWRPNFTKLAKDLASEGVRVVNCTRITALECFERMSLEAYLAHRF